MTDDQLMDLVRDADPLDDADPIELDADAVLAQILAEPQEPAARPRRRSIALRLGVVGAVAALVAVAVFAVTGDDRGGVTPASAAVIRHAISAVTQPEHTILHVDMRGTQDNGDGTTVTWRDESWQENTAPYDRRQLETGDDGRITESGTLDGNSQVYDPARGTIYTSSPPPADMHRKYWISKGPRPGTFTLRTPVIKVTPGKPFKVMPGGPKETIIITAEQLKALRAGTEVVKWKRQPGAGKKRFALAVVPAAANAPRAPSCDVDPGSGGFPDQIVTLLRNCGAQVVGHATIAGRDTLEIRSRDGHTTYYVDSTTYAPVELDATGTDGGTRLRFEAYEVLPATQANEALLSLAAQHPSAIVDRDPAHYQAAEMRMFPHG
jgi:hypothetical protein